MTELKENLIPHSSGFNVDIATLETVFQADNIHSGRSLEVLKNKFGGAKGLLSAFKTNLHEGIEGSAADLSSRVQYFESNEFIEPPASTVLDFMIAALDDFTLKVLLVAAIASLVIGISTEGLAHGWYEGGAIFFAVGLIVAITTVNDYMQDQQFRKLFKKSDVKIVKVKRGGKLIEINAEQLVAGDILEVTTGLIFPADCILLSRNDVFLVDESQITGESILMKKDSEERASEEATPFLISGTLVMDGDGYVLVACVGLHSALGKTRASLQTEPEPTPLQLKLEDLANTIGIIGTTGALLTFAGCILGLVIKVMNSEDGSLFSMESLTEVLSFLILAITIIVMAVPEGLPMAVTIALAFSVNTMKNENNLVRELEACETMGNATDICSDKTGTLTKNDMTVVNLYVNSVMHDVQTKIEAGLKADEIVQEICRAVAINSVATPNFSIPNKDQTGNRTELALLTFAKECGVNYNSLRPSESILKSKPFSSERKKMSTLYQEKDGSKWIIVKGAPEIILRFCTKYSDKGKILELTKDVENTIYKKALEFIGKKSARAIGVCKVEVPKNIDPETANFDDYEKEMIFIGVFGIQDPVRPDVPAAVLQCQKANVTVRMVTGDNTMIATAIAKDCHILPTDYREQSDDNIVLEGKEFREKVGGLKWKEEVDKKGKKIKIPYVGDMTMFKEVARNLRVLGRSLPEDKLLLVTGLQALDRIVSVTGDGTNDAAALKKANVGFGMGKAGTDVCKDASSIVILDDNFSSIITAILYGRNVFEAIRKFVQFQLTVNLVAMSIAIICGFTIQESPLNAIQMLWLNVIMDSFASLALATEPPNKDELLSRPPTRKNEKIITEFMWRSITIQGILQLITLFIILFFGYEWLGVESSIGVSGLEWNYENGLHYTFFFNVFVFLQMFNFINARILKREILNPFHNIFNNPIFWLVMVVTFIGQICFIELIGKPVRCTPLSLELHLYSMGIGALSLVFSIISKLIPVKFLPIPNFLTEHDNVDLDGVNKGIVSKVRGSVAKRSKSRMMHNH